MKKSEEERERENLKKLSLYWTEFHNKLRKWTQDELVLLPPHSLENEEFTAWAKQCALIKNKAIKEHISSTHQWVQGKDRWSKKYDNWFTYPLECKVCKMGASKYDELEFGRMEEVIDIPSRDMHGSCIHRTCEEVQAAKKSRKGKKCMQCGTYGCIYNWI